MTDTPTEPDGEGSDKLNVFQRHQLREAYHEYGEVRCEDCGPIDLSDADDLEEAISIWNDHVRTEHQVGSA